MTPPEPRVLLTRCDRCRDPVAELWPVLAQRRVALHCALCAVDAAPVPPEQVRARLRERLASFLARHPHLARW